MPIFGITASSNMSIKLTDFYQIATTTVGSGGATDITFSNIPGTYNHLQIRGITRNGSVTDTTLVQVNGDTTNYSWHTLRGNGSAASSSGNANQTYIEAPYTAYSGVTANAFGAVVIDIFDYANTNKYKTLKLMGGADFNGSGGVHFNSGNWRSTSAITSIKIYPSTGSFAQYTSLALYGVKA